MIRTFICCGLLAISCGASTYGRQPETPPNPFDYFSYAVTNLPEHFRTGVDPPTSRDNTPADNQITNAGAALGRVLFYDERLSHNNGVSCASCHGQSTGFSDPDEFSAGFEGGLTGRHSMALTNSKFYEGGKMFWDERAVSLEQQVLMPVQDPIEMGMDLTVLNSKLQKTSFYGGLFEDAFGDSEITSDRISKALAQFVRSMVSYESKYDSAFDAVTGLPDFESVFNDAELRGHALFNGSARCSQCHESTAQVGAETANVGLDATNEDEGAGGGEFKTTSLRNIAVRERFMHDGRFTSLKDVVEFYNTLVQDNPNLDFKLRDISGAPLDLGLLDSEVDDIVAFLQTLTDESFLSSAMFSDPFGKNCDFEGDGDCDVNDIELILASGNVAEGVEVSPSNEIFDVNGDGLISELDVDRWLADASQESGGKSYLPGDVDLDGNVDSTDLQFLLNDFGSTTSISWSNGNFNGDNIIDSRDLGVMLNNFGFTSGQTNSVPEPNASSIFLIVALATLATYRRRRL